MRQKHELATKSNNMYMSMGSLVQMLKWAWPYLAAILLQFGYASMPIICKFALDQGLSPHVLAVYRRVVAFLIITPFALFYDSLGKVDVRRVHSQAKILGTIVTVGGAMTTTLVKGSMLNLPWTKGVTDKDSRSASDKHNLVCGALMIAAGCVCWSVFITLQVITLKSYPAALSLTAWICLMDSVEGTVFVLVTERHNPSAWSIHLDSKLLAVVYSGVICSGIAYYVQGLIGKAKGLVFVSAFNPLSMVILAIMGSIVLAEKIYIGRVYGAIVIVIGLYMVLWGESKDSGEVKSSPPTGSNFSESKESA